MRAIVIPVKEPVLAKQRLAPILGAGERMALAWALFEDVALAVCRWTSEYPHEEVRVILVTSYGRAAAHAETLGWEVLREETQTSESASIDWASGVLFRRGISAVLRLPADIPLVEPSDIRELFECPLSPPAALLTPSRDGLGTNAILRHPPNLFPSRFGEGSLARHRDEARRVGAVCAIVENRRVALDIDDAADVAALLRQPGATRTQQLLRDWRVDQKLEVL